MQRQVLFDTKVFCELLYLLRAVGCLDTTLVMSSDDLKDVFFEAERLRPMLEQKAEKVAARTLFTAYKTAKGAQREELRTKYLDFVGYAEDWRTDSEQPEEQLPEQVELDDFLDSDELPECPLEVGYTSQSLLCLHWRQ